MNICFRKPLILLFIFPLLSIWIFPEQVKENQQETDVKTVNKESVKRHKTLNNNLEKKMINLEKRIEYLEKKIAFLEKKVREISGSESQIRLTLKSSQIIRGATKEGIKFEINIDNLTGDFIDFIFGDIKFINSYGDVLHSEKFYFDQPIFPYSNAQTVIMVDSTSRDFEKLKQAEELKIKFFPSRIIKKDKKR